MFLFFQFLTRTKVTKNIRSLGSVHRLSWNNLLECYKQKFAQYDTIPLREQPSVWLCETPFEDKSQNSENKSFRSIRLIPTGKKKKKKETLLCYSIKILYWTMTFFFHGDWTITFCNYFIFIYAYIPSILIYLSIWIT